MIIRDAQLKVLEQVSVDSFIVELCEHCKEFAPDLVGTMSDEQLIAAVRSGIERAESHGFDKRGPTRFYVDLMIAFGAGFDSDPQYPWAADILAKKEELEQMERSDALHAKSGEAFSILFGPDNEHSKKAIRQVLTKFQDGLQFKRENFRQDMLVLFKEIHPLKYDLVGESALADLVNQAIARGRDRYGFSAPRAMAVMVLLMFALGHKFDQDPFHPWVSHSLNKSVENPEEAADELESRAMLWFEAASK